MNAFEFLPDRVRRRIPGPELLRAFRRGVHGHMHRTLWPGRKPAFHRMPPDQFAHHLAGRALDCDTSEEALRAHTADIFDRLGGMEGLRDIVIKARQDLERKGRRVDEEFNPLKPGRIPYLPALQVASNNNGKSTPSDKSREDEEGKEPKEEQPLKFASDQGRPASRPSGRRETIGEHHQSIIEERTFQQVMLKANEYDSSLGKTFNAWAHGIARGEWWAYLTKQDKHGNPSPGSFWSDSQNRQAYSLDDEIESDDCYSGGTRLDQVPGYVAPDPTGVEEPINWYEALNSSNRRRAMLDYYRERLAADKKPTAAGARRYLNERGMSYGRDMFAGMWRRFLHNMRVIERMYAERDAKEAVLSSAASPAEHCLTEETKPVRRAQTEADPQKLIGAVRQRNSLIRSLTAAMVRAGMPISREQVFALMQFVRTYRRPTLSSMQAWMVRASLPMDPDLTRKVWPWVARSLLTPTVNKGILFGPNQSPEYTPCRGAF